MMPWWFPDDALLMPCWCPDDALMMQWWCTDDALMMRWWCNVDALMMHWQCPEYDMMHRGQVSDLHWRFYGGRINGNKTWQPTTDNRRRRQGEYRAICLGKVGRQSFAIQICAQHKYKYKYCHNPIPQSSATCHDLHNANALLWHWTYTVLAQIKKVNDPVPKYQQIQKWDLHSAL